MSKLILITQSELEEIKKSPSCASELFKKLHIKGWPRVVTIQGVHHLEVK